MVTPAPPSPPRAGGYPADAFDRMAAIPSDNYWFASRNRLIAWALREYFPEATSFLDVGCGTGTVLEALSKALPTLRLSGTDLSEAGLQHARQRVPTATFFRMDARHLDVPAPYDVAGSFDVLEHVPDDEGALRRIHAAVRPGGGLLVAVPQHPWLWSSADDQAHHVRRYRRRELVERVASAGFEPVRVTSFVSLLLPLMAVSRWRDARRTRGPAASELKVSRPLNTTLRGMLSVERLAIRAGVSFPAGGSLLVVARRSG